MQFVQNIFHPIVVLIWLNFVWKVEIFLKRLFLWWDKNRREILISVSWLANISAIFSRPGNARDILENSYQDFDKTLPICIVTFSRDSWENFRIDIMDILSGKINISVLEPMIYQNTEWLIRLISTKLHLALIQLFCNRLVVQVTK